MRIEKIIIIKWRKIIVFKVKKLLSLFVGTAITANIFATMPFTAFADNEIEHIYTYDVTNSWGNTELIAVTLSNTSDTTIENWMLYFEPNGQVHNVVNASESYTSTGTAYFRNSWYNANVEPNSSTTFNYMVDDCSGIPDEFVLCQTRAEKETGYDVSIKVNETWGNSFNGEIILQNNTESAIEAWELMVDTNFTITEITNSWAATVTELEPYSYMLKGTYTGFVPANSSVSLGFTGVMDGEPEISNYSLTEVVVDENLFRSPESTNPVVDGDLENNTIYAEAIYDSENENINISWTATSPGTFFEIYVSDDNINYELYETVDGNIFNTSYNTVDDFLIKYFKVKQILPDTENINAIYSNICYAVYTPNSVNWKEHLRPWTIDDSNEVLSKINTDDNPYKLSLEFNAAGIPDIHLNVVESYYTNALNNDAVLGMASEIIYKDDLKIQDLVVKYEINDNYTDNELGILENLFS